jgi:predicted TIM-barrel fold metal-dependent hydrolase
MPSTRPAHVVDFHTHIFPDRIVDRAIGALRESYQVVPIAHPTVSGLLEVMAEGGIDVSVSVPVATRPDQVRSINEWAAGVQQEHPGRLICFGALHPEVADLAAEVGHIASLGLKGIKLQPNFQQCSPDDPKLFAAYEAAIAQELIVLFHSGQDIGAVETIYSTPQVLARLHRQFPQLTMVVAHLGGYQMWGEVRRHLLGRPIHLDASYCPPDQLSDEEFLHLTRAHGLNRVVFGSDFPWSSPGGDLARLCNIGLSQDELEAIAWRNAADLLRINLSSVV